MKPNKDPRTIKPAESETLLHALAVYAKTTADEMDEFAARQVWRHPVSKRRARIIQKTLTHRIAQMVLIMGHLSQAAERGQ